MFERRRQASTPFDLEPNAKGPWARIPKSPTPSQPRFCPRLEVLECRLTPSVAPTLHLDTNPKNIGSQPSLIGETNDHFFMLANDGVHGRELYSSNGTESGITLLNDSNPGSADTVIYSSKVLNDVFYYIIKDSLGNQSLWKSDGTPLGTREVVSLYPESEKWNLSEIISFQGRLYFYAVNPSQVKLDLWTSNGTREGTRKVKEIQSDGEYFDFELTNKLFLTNQYIYFV